MRLLRPLLQILMAIAWLGVVPFSHATSGDSAPFPLDTRNYDDSTPLFSVDTRAPDVIANTGIIDSGGTSFTISMEMLKVTGGGPITFTLVTAPVHGKLLLSGTEQGAGATFTQAQIDSGSLSYQRGAGDPLSDTFEVAAMDDDAGPLGGNLTFAVAGVPRASGSLFLVDTRNYDDSTPLFSVDTRAPDVIANTGIIDSGGTSFVITMEMLKVTGGGPITFTLVTAPVHGKLLLSGTEQGAGATFTQAQIDSGSLSYQRGAGDPLSDTFEVAAMDDHAGLLGGNLTFAVAGVPRASGSLFLVDTRNYDDSTPLFSVDTRAPDVIANTGIIDSGGTSFTISMEMLKVTGGGPITFTLVTAPVHGKLLLSGTEQGAGATFTQAQIDSGSLSYQRGAGDPLSDTFEVAAMDDHAGLLGGNLTFAVAGVPRASGSLFLVDTRNYDDSTPLFSVDTRAPDVIANTGIIDSGGTSFTISMEMLKVTGGGPITFTLVTAPVHGKLLLSGTEQGAGATFTQAQIDSGSLSYQRGAGDPLSDTFEVAAMDDDAGPLGGNLTFAVAGIPGASGSLFLVDTRNYTESADSTVHTDRRAHLTADTVPGSLRQAIANAAAGETVDFDDSLSGETVELDGAALVIKKAVRIEGSALAAGVTVDAGTGANRVFDVISGGALELEALTLKGGEAGTGRGGAIYGQTGSSVIVKRCTLTNHHALEGGAIFTLGPLLIENSTLTGNSGGYGGAVQCLGTPSSITCSTIAGNSATNGGGIYNKNTTLTLTNSIVAENGGEDIRNEMAHLSYAGANLVQSVILDADSGITGSLPLTVPPLLAPLGDYGGPTQTMAVLHESPAINAAGGNVPLTDQRGFARDDGAPDIGAYEFYVNASAGYVSWERGVTASPPAPKTHWLPVNDEDRDQSSNFAEYVGGDGPDMSAEFLAGEPNIYRDGNDRYFETKVRLRRDDSDLSFAVEFKADDGSPWATQALTTDGTDWILAAGRLEIPASGSTGPSGRPGVDVVHFRDTVAIAAGLAGMMRIRVSDRHGNVASTDLEGFYGSACPSGSDTALAQPFQRRPVFRGAAAAEASGVDRIKPAFLLPSQRLIPDVFANHFVRGLGGAGAGHFYRILGNTDLEVILEISPGEVPAFAVGQAFEIVPYWTLSTLFQSDMNPAVHDSSGDSVFGRRTTLMLSNITSTGTNLGAGGIYYRPESDTWKVAFDHDPSSSVGDNADGVGIEPDAYFTVRHRPVSDLTTLGICYGSVSPAALRVPISTLAGDSQDNPVGLGNGFSTTLEDLALRADSAFVDSLGTGIFARRDTLLVYDNALAAQLKVASAIYYYFDDGGGNTWWEAKSNTAVVAAETIFPPGSVGVWRATSSDGITRYWMRPQN